MAIGVAALLFAACTFVALFVDMVGDGWAWVGFDSQGNGWSEADRDAIYMANGRVFATPARGG